MTLLHHIVREHLATFLVEAQGRYPSGEFPRFIRAEFERYLRCGLLCHGFARVRCSTCHDKLADPGTIQPPTSRTVVPKQRLFFLPADGTSRVYSKLAEEPCNIAVHLTLGQLLRPCIFIRRRA